MDICFFLKGLIVILSIHHCKSEDLSSTLPSIAAPSQDGEASHKEMTLPPGAVAPAVAPPSLKEVEQAVQEATEQVEGGGAQEVLKELLERVVEAALVEAAAAVGGHEAKADDAEGGGGQEELAGEETGEAEAGAVEQTVDEEVVGQDEEAQGEDVVGGEAPGEVQEAMGEVEAVEVDAAEAAEDSEGLEEAAGEPAVEPAEVELEGPAEGPEVIGESPVVPEIIQEVVEETVEPLEEVGGEVTVVDEGGGDGEEEPEMVLVEEVAPEAEVQEVENMEQETVVVSDLGAPDAEQTEGLTGEVEEPQGGEAEGAVVIAVLPPDDYETTQSVVGEPTEEKEVDVTVGDEAEGSEEEKEQIPSVVEGGTAEEVEAGNEEVVEAGEAADGETGGESVTEGETEVSVAEEGVAVGTVDQLEAIAGDEEQTAVIVPDPSHADIQDVMAIPAPEAAADDGADDDGTAVEEQGSDEGQAAPLGPPLGGAEPVSNAMGGEDLLEEETNHANEIITSTADLLPHDPVVPEPTLDNFVEELPATPPQSEDGGEEPGETNELVEETADDQGSGELGLEAWKIGAISAAVFLVLETIVIIVYIVKCRNRTNSVPASERTCEEGCVEPEATTADCSDDTLPAGNGDTQQIAALDPSDVATTLAKQQADQQQEQATAMSDLSPASPGESATGTGSSPDVRTSVL